MAEKPRSGGAHDGFRGVRVRRIQAGSRSSRARARVAGRHARFRDAGARTASAPRLGSVVSTENSAVHWGVAKLVKAPDFDSGIRGFESFLPSHNTGCAR